MDSLRPDSRLAVSNIELLITRDKANQSLVKKALEILSDRTISLGKSVLSRIPRTFFRVVILHFGRLELGTFFWRGSRLACSAFKGGMPAI